MYNLTCLSFIFYPTTGWSCLNHSSLATMRCTHLSQLLLNLHYWSFGSEVGSLNVTLAEVITSRLIQLQNSFSEKQDTLGIDFKCILKLIISIKKTVHISAKFPFKHCKRCGSTMTKCCSATARAQCSRIGRWALHGRLLITANFLWFSPMASRRPDSQGALI